MLLHEISLLGTEVRLHPIGLGRSTQELGLGLLDPGLFLIPSVFGLVLISVGTKASEFLAGCLATGAALLLGLELLGIFSLEVLDLRCGIAVDA